MSDSLAPAPATGRGKSARKTPPDPGEGEFAFDDVELLPHQRWPEGDKFIRLFLGGRGAGKTFAGAYWVIHHLRTAKADAVVHVIAPTLTQVRRVNLEGPAGLYRLFKDEFVS